MKKAHFLFLFTFVLFLAACGSATPPQPITAVLDGEFTLAPDQTATIQGVDLAITLVGVSGDERCPAKIECAMTGPVSAQIKVASSSSAPMEFLIQSFSSSDGSVVKTLDIFTLDSDESLTKVTFEGIDNGVEYDGFSIRLKSVLPFPQYSTSEISASSYRVSFVVSK